MDNLYIGDIPLNNSDDVKLFFDENGRPCICENPAHFQSNENLHYYVIFPNLQNGKFIYESTGTEKSLIQNNIFYSIKVSHKWYDRSDALTILSFFCCITVTTIWLTNLFTSCFKKGGLLSGLF